MLLGPGEPEVVRHFVNLSKLNYSIDEGMYPLGSCTMKYNPKINEKTAALDGFAMGLGLTLVLAVLGGIREIIGKGTLFSGIDLALGDMAKDWVIHVVPSYNGFLVAILPPGAFIGLALLIAGKNWLNLRAERKQKGANAVATPVEGGCSPAGH